MAFSDFEVQVGHTSSGAFQGGNDGTQQTNSALSNPLTQQGPDCRLFVVDAGSYHQALYCPDTTLYPNLNAIPDTKAVRVEAFIRKDGTYVSSRECAIGIGVKTGNIDAVSGNDRCPSGYWVFVGARSLDGADNLRYVRQDVNGNAEYDITDFSFAPGGWYHVRLTAIPTLNGAVVDRDTVILEENTGTEASPIWTERLNYEVLDSAPGYIPWGHASSGRVGFYAHGERSLSVSANTYIDSFRASLGPR